jgi:hypothetical protein
MPNDTQPIDATASLSRIAAFVLIVIVGLLAMVVGVHPRTGAVQGSSIDATDTVAEWGD